MFVWISLFIINNSGLVSYSSKVKSIVDLLISPILIVMLIAMLYLAKYDIISTLQLRSLKIQDVILISILVIGIASFEHGFRPILYKLLPFYSELDSAELESYTNILGQLILYLNIFLLIPMFEEFLFRGLIQTSICARYGIRKAIIIPSLLYGLLHVIPPEVITLIIRSLLFGYVVHKTRSIFTAITMHSLLNMFSFLYNSFLLGNTASAEVAINYYISSGFIIFGTIIIISGIRFLGRTPRRMESKR